MSSTVRVEAIGRAPLVRVEVTEWLYTPGEARALAKDLLDAASEADNLPGIHERHVNLKASCALCVAEAGGQTDRLEPDEED